MRSQLCQHADCGQKSHTGCWCQDCIEREWPWAPLGDKHHWIVWKGVDRVHARLFTGALGCPYQLGQVLTATEEMLKRSPFVAFVFRTNWLLSLLGAIKVGYGTHILAAVVCARCCRLRPDLVLDSFSPVLPLAAFPRNKLPAVEQATAWLADVNSHLSEIEGFEQRMRDRVQRQVANTAEQLAILEREEQRIDALYEARKRKLEEFRKTLAPELERALAGLSDAEQEILMLRYGLEDGRRRMLKEVAAVFGITRERVRQIEQKALERLKQSGHKR